MMKVNKVFYSIQGEGLYQNTPMVFIRLQGCNLLTPCVFCDTEYAQDFTKGVDFSTEEVEREVLRLLPYAFSWVCITGGEPLAQKDELFKLVRGLQKYGYCLTVETNGSLPKPDWWTLVHSWSADIKCPSSGVCGISLVDDWFRARKEDQIKFVVSTKEDLRFACKTINSKVACNPQIFISPAFTSRAYYTQVGREGLSEIHLYQEWFQEVAEFCKDMRVKISIQQHKIIWGNKKGV